MRSSSVYVQSLLENGNDKRIN